MSQLRGTFHKDRNAYIASGQPAIFHCHHYNCFLQATILDTSAYLPGIKDMLVDVAQEIAYSQFSSYYSENDMSEAEKKAAAADYFRFAGFGVINLDDISADGGVVRTSSDHYGVGWLSKFGKNNEPVSFFTRGYLAGVCEAIFGLALGSMDCDQTTCIAMGDDKSTFGVAASARLKDLKPSVGEGNFTTGELHQPESPVNYGAIRDALTGMPIEGAADSGIIDAFGVLLTRHYANYYCEISNRFLRLFVANVGEESRDVAIELLTEAGHVCAFNTFGGVMQSNEWNAMIKPMFENNDDWVHGIVAVVNAFGWGFWKIEEFVPNEKLVLSVNSGYETNSYTGEKSDVPMSFLVTGGTAGIMNLNYTLDLPNTAPVTLDEARYKSIHDHAGFFSAAQNKCRSMGESQDQFEATKAV
jgi:hypothetical protein